MNQKRKVGRPRKEPTRVLPFRVPADKAEYLKQEIMKLIKKLLAVLLVSLSLVSCTKSDPLQFTKVKVEQAGELIRVFGYLEVPQPQPHRYVIQAMVCGEVREMWVDIAAGQVTGYADYQDNCKVVGWKIVYDDILRQ